MTDKINVKNNHTGKLDIAGVEARSGATVAVDAKTFGSWKLSSAAKSWLESGIVEEVSNKAAQAAAKKEAAAAEPTPEPVKEPTRDRATLLARAKELNLNLAANVSNADLLKAVEEAEKK